MPRYSVRVYDSYFTDAVVVAMDEKDAHKRAVKLIENGSLEPEFLGEQDWYATIVGDNDEFWPRDDMGIDDAYWYGREIE